VRWVAHRLGEYQRKATASLATQSSEKLFKKKVAENFGSSKISRNFAKFFGETEIKSSSKGEWLDSKANPNEHIERFTIDIRVVQELNKAS
jgi:hypothetical protein